MINQSDAIRLHSVEVAPCHNDDRTATRFQRKESGAVCECATNSLLARLGELEEANRRLEEQLAQRRRVEDNIVMRVRDLERRLEKRNVQYQEATRIQNSMARFLGELCANPLQDLDSQARLVLERWEQSLPPEGRKQMATVLNKTRELRGLMDSVATYALVEKQPLDRQTVDTAALVGDVIQELHPQMDGRCVEIRTGDLPRCHADPSMLRVVFTQLFSNALKFTRTRDVTSIEILCRVANDETIWSVRDNGIGFDKEQAHRLFRPFQRIHRRHGYEGAGIGLATAHRIISHHGGRIWAEANGDSPGATFHFALPGA